MLANNSLIWSGSVVAKLAINLDASQTIMALISFCIERIVAKLITILQTWGLNDSSSTERVFCIITQGNCPPCCQVNFCRRFLRQHVVGQINKAIRIPRLDTAHTLGSQALKMRTLNNSLIFAFAEILRKSAREQWNFEFLVLLIGLTYSRNTYAVCGGVCNSRFWLASRQRLCSRQATAWFLSIMIELKCAVF